MDKALSSAGGPAKCQYCGKLSYANAGFRVLSSLFAEVLFITALIASFYYWSWWPLALLGCFLVALPAISVALPATPTTSEGASRVRKLQVMGLLVVVLGMVAIAVTHGS